MSTTTSSRRDCQNMCIECSISDGFWMRKISCVSRWKSLSVRKVVGGPVSGHQQCHRMAALREHQYKICFHKKQNHFFAPLIELELRWSFAMRRHDDGMTSDGDMMTASPAIWIESTRSKQLVIVEYFIYAHFIMQMIDMYRPMSDDEDVDDSKERQTRRRWRNRLPITIWVNMTDWIAQCISKNSGTCAMWCVSVWVWVLDRFNMEMNMTWNYWWFLVIIIRLASSASSPNTHHHNPFRTAKKPFSSSVLGAFETETSNVASVLRSSNHFKCVLLLSLLLLVFFRFFFRKKTTLCFFVKWNSVIYFDGCISIIEVASGMSEVFG